MGGDGLAQLPDPSGSPYIQGGGPGFRGLGHWQRRREGLGAEDAFIGAEPRSEGRRPRARLLLFRDRQRGPRREGALERAEGCIGAWFMPSVEARKSAASAKGLRSRSALGVARPIEKLHAAQAKARQEKRGPPSEGRPRRWVPRSGRSAAIASSRNARPAPVIQTRLDRLSSGVGPHFDPAPPPSRSASGMAERRLGHLEGGGKFQRGAPVTDADQVVRTAKCENQNALRQPASKAGAAEACSMIPISFEQLEENRAREVRVRHSPVSHRGASVASARSAGTIAEAADYLNRPALGREPVGWTARSKSSAISGIFLQPALAGAGGKTDPLGGRREIEPEASRAQAASRSASARSLPGVTCQICRHRRARSGQAFALAPLPKGGALLAGSARGPRG